MSESFSISALMKSLRKRIGAKDKTEEAEGAQGGSEEASKALPSEVMPRGAVVKKRAQLKQLDAETKED
jgi:hypothetical protein